MFCDRCGSGLNSPESFTDVGVGSPLCAECGLELPDDFLTKFNARTRAAAEEESKREKMRRAGQLVWHDEYVKELRRGEYSKYSHHRVAAEQLWRIANVLERLVAMGDTP